MKVSIKMLFVLFTLLSFSCSDSDDDNSGYTGYDDLSGTYKSNKSENLNKLTLFYNSESLDNKEIIVKDYEKAKIDLTLKSIIPQEDESEIKGVILKENEGKYSFEGEYITQKSNKISFSGEISGGGYDAKHLMLHLKDLN